MANTKKGAGMHLTTGLISAALTLLGGVLYFLSHKTNYYILGQMNSGLILALIGCALVVELAAILLVKKYPKALWAQLLTFAVTALLAASAMLIVGDRVEGIGNCILTDYDAGHGGEEAIYLSLIGAAGLLSAMVYNIIGSFSKDGNAPAGSGKKLALTISAAVLGVAAIVATVMLTGAGTPKTAAVRAGGETGGSFTVSFNQGDGNIESMPDYQFLSADMASLLKYDSRSYIDITLTLDGAGSYTLVSDYYVLEAGKRAEIGDPSGLGLVYRTTSEGSYTENEDGTVTTAAASHVFFELHTDTYSEQMKQLMKLDLNGSDADGDYDSADVPSLLDFVPETVWTLSDSEIVSYLNPHAEEEEEPVEEEPAAPAAEGVTIPSDDGATTLTFNPDGSYRFFFEAYSIEDIGTYTYEGGVLRVTNPKGDTFTAEGDPMALHYVCAVSDQVTGDFTIPAESFGGTQTEEEEIVSATVASADQATTMTFFSDGRYVFAFGAYSIVDEGTYAFSDGALTLTDANGKETKAEGDPFELHYAYSMSDQLTGDFTVPAELFAFDKEGSTVYSNDLGTTIRFLPDGGYCFEFASYSIVDEGAYTFSDGILTLTDANAKKTTAEGDPLALHYAYSASDQLTGDYTIPASLFGE